MFWLQLVLGYVHKQVSDLATGKDEARFSLWRKRFNFATTEVEQNKVL